MIKTTTRFAAALALTLALLAFPGCSTNGQGDDAVPLFLEVTFPAGLLGKSVSSGLPLQFDTVAFKSVMKNPAQTTSPMLDTRIDDYVVEWKRIDGGTKAPKPETFASSVLVPVGGTASITNSMIMSIAELTQSPLDQLLPFNGGIDRETGNSQIRCAGKVTYRGHTLAGQPVQATATFDMTFLY